MAELNSCAEEDLQCLVPVGVTAYTPSNRAMLQYPSLHHRWAVDGSSGYNKCPICTRLSRNMVVYLKVIVILQLTCKRCVLCYCRDNFRCYLVFAV